MTEKFSIEANIIRYYGLKAKIDNEIENCTINIFELLQKAKLKLEPTDVLSYADDFYKQLDRQNNKVIDY